jgi:hypothetical protein
VVDDLVANLDLAAHRTDGDQRPFKLAGFGELIEQIGDGGDLVGLGAQCVQGLETPALVMGSARRLAVDRDEIVPPRPQRRDPALEAAAKQGLGS